MRHLFPARAAPNVRPGRAQLLGMLLLALTLAAGVVVAHLYQDGMLSWAQLDRALADVTGHMLPAVHAMLGSRRTLGGLAFATGLALGWLAAWQWITARHRQRSLVIADLRQGDMPFVEGIDHVRRHAHPYVPDDTTAVELILETAGRGRISLWRQAPSDALSRVPSRHIRLAAGQIVDLAARSATGSALRSFLLLRVEVEQRWPSARAASIVIGHGATERGR